MMDLEPPQGDSPNNDQDPSGDDRDGQPAAEVMVGYTLAEVDQMKAELDEVRQEAQKNLDGWQRALADYSNLKRRAEGERAGMQQEAIGDAVKPFLDVLEDLDLALRNRPAELGHQAWAEGIELVVRKLHSRLQAHGLEVIAATGEAFDPRLHEAISTEASEEFASGQVIEILKPGFRIGDRVLRPALVRVAV